MDGEYQILGETMEEIDKVIDDVVVRRPIILLSDRGHGKSTSLQTIIHRLKEKHNKIIVKVFDISLAWYHKAPVKWRQRITLESLMNEDYLNIPDCVYELGSLDKDVRRWFVSTIMNQDYKSRYDLGIDDFKALKDLPVIIYVLEEANTYFGSFSLRKNDGESKILNDFISVGRNLGLSAFMVVTAEVGELSPSLRRRSTRLIGRIINDYDLRNLNRKADNLGKTCSSLPRFHWIYFNGSVSETFRIYDEVESVPVDFAKETVESIVEVEPEKKKRGFWDWMLGRP